MCRLSYYRMADVPEETKDRLRELTFGRENESPLYRWTFHDRAWCVVARLHSQSNRSHSTPSGRIAGWAALTLQDDYLPVAGVYVDQRYRRQGLAKLAAKCLMDTLHRRGLVGPVQAVSELWAEWPEVIEAAGFEFVEWE